MIAQTEIREKISRYLRSDISLDQFEDWLVQRSWNMHRDSDEDAQQLAAAVELRLAEHSSGHLDEAGLREELRSFVLTMFTVRIEFGSVSAESVQFSQDNQNNVINPIKAAQFSFSYPAFAPAGT